MRGRVDLAASAEARSQQCCVEQGILCDLNGKWPLRLEMSTKTSSEICDFPFHFSDLRGRVEFIALSGS